MNVVYALVAYNALIALILGYAGVAGARGVRFCGPPLRCTVWSRSAHLDEPSRWASRCDGLMIGVGRSELAQHVVWEFYNVRYRGQFN